MKMEVHLSQRLEQRMQLSQQMLQNLELLQMPILALKERIDQELEENPALELAPDVDESPEAAAARERAAEADERDEDRRREFLERVEEEFREVSRPASRVGSSEESDRKMEFLQNIGAPPEDLREHLRRQVGVLDLDERLRTYIDHLIENLDDDGYVRDDLPTVAQSLPEDLRRLPAETLVANLEAALRVIQRLEPRGVGARNRRECLLLQLDAHDPLLAPKQLLIERHLDDIGNNRLPRIVKAVLNDPEALADFGYKPPGDPDCVLDDIKHLIAEIGRLNPRPGSTHSSQASPSVTPEVIIRQIDGRYEIMLEDSYLPPITVNRAYQEMLKSGTLEKKEKDYLRQKLDAGKKLISAIEQRRNTIQRITTEILKHQMDFFEHGIESLRPLKMQDVANVVGIHVSTVSRAISEKWIETPRGIFPMKFFFAGAAPKQEQQVSALIAGTAAPQEEATRLALMEKIRAIVDAEDTREPLSDLQIAKILKQQGMAAARRTIAKYREELGIPSSRLRKQY